MKDMRTAIRLITAAGILAAAGISPAARPEPEPPRPIDEQLLDELGNDPIDELDRELFDPGDRRAGPGDPPGEGPDDLRDRLQRELGKAAVAEDDNLLLKVARSMRELEGRIARNDSGLTTQAQQQQVIDDLDRLIEQARKQCQGSKPGSKPSQKSSNQPKKGSPGKKPGAKPGVAPVMKIGNGESRQADKQQTQTFMKELWKVTLPQQQRDQLLQSPFDEFLPKYELLIEQYFRRLTEEEDQR